MRAAVDAGIRVPVRRGLQFQKGGNMTTRWKETGGTWEPDHTLLNDEQLGKCTRAYDSEEMFPSPVPTRVVSNGEYMPPPQSNVQKKVEARIKELADEAAKKLGVGRREFLASSGGLAASFLAMNEVHGKFFNVDKEELFEPAASYGKAPPKDLFVVDDQLHFVRQNRANGPIGAIALRAIAQGPSITQSMRNAFSQTGVPPITSNPFNPSNVGDEFGNPWGVWNPDLIGMPVSNDMFNIVNFIKSVFLDAQVTVGLISNVTAFVSGPSGQNPGTPPLNRRLRDATSSTSWPARVARWRTVSSTSVAGISTTSSTRRRTTTPTRGRATTSPTPPRSIRARCGSGSTTTRTSRTPPSI
jgi:hypothetical protein